MTRHTDHVIGYRLSRSWSGPMAVVIAIAAFAAWALGYVPEPCPSTVSSMCSRQLPDLVV